MGPGTASTLIPKALEWCFCAAVQHPSICPCAFRPSLTVAGTDRQRQAEAGRDNQRQPETTRDNQRQAETGRD
eukprot:10855200-Alexandrium_andersonii.AAC.1